MRKYKIEKLGNNIFRKFI